LTAKEKHKNPSLYNVVLVENAFFGCRYPDSKKTFGKTSLFWVIINSFEKGHGSQ
jgi:hypothetical protein